MYQVKLSFLEKLLTYKDPHYFDLSSHSVKQLVKWKV